MDTNFGLKKNWSETKIKLKQKFAMLKDSDVFMADGKQEDMLSRLQKKLCITKEELQKLITEL